MPTYEYLCEKCKHRFERMQKLADAPVRKCPKCEGRVRRVIGIGGVLTKGGAASSPPACESGTCENRSFCTNSDECDW